LRETDRIFTGELFGESRFARVRAIKIKLTMVQPFLSRTVLVFLSGTLAVVSVACGQDKQTTVTRGKEQSLPMGNLAAIQPPVKPTLPPASPKPEVPARSVNEISAFELALDKAAGATTISKSAQSKEDWYLVASQFQDAIALMKKIPRDSPNFKFAQTQIWEYRRQVQYAQQKANPRALSSPTFKPKPVIVMVPQPATTPKRTLSLVRPQPKQLASSGTVVPPAQLFTQEDVFSIPIKRRLGGTPIIEVTFNGRQRFEMIVDTGASGTVITQQMANALGIVPVGKAKANTVSARAVEFPVGYVDSMEVGGVMANKIPVAIAGLELETGLLGHDFFGNYDVTIKRNVIEFRPQLRSEVNSSETRPTAPTLSRGYRFVTLL
jgi:predicted aspartyl protease